MLLCGAGNDFAVLRESPQRAVIHLLMPVPIEDDDIPAVRERGTGDRRFRRNLVALTRLLEAERLQNRRPSRRAQPAKRSTFRCRGQ
jgi:hypothetical protein